MLDNIKFCRYIVILCIVLMLERIEAHSLRKASGSYLHGLQQDVNKMTKDLLKRQLRLHHKMDSSLPRLVDIETENSQLISHNYHHHHHHLLKKRHGKSFITTEMMNNNIMKEFGASRNKQFESFEVQVKELQNNSLCNYTVTSITNSEDYILPKNLINITCNYSGSRCQTNGFYCCLQTYTHIQVSLKEGGTRSMRINTGCVCALQLFNHLKQNPIQLDINA